MNHRNPVGILHERFQSGGVKPQYQLLRATGTPNAPTFSFQVSVGRITCVGSGPSKKQAKIAAAQSMLHKLDEKEPTTKPKTENKTLAEEDIACSKVRVVSETAKSSVEMLEDMCAKHGYRAPVYDDEREQGKTFSIICSVGDIRRTGVGHSRGQARNEAAHRLLGMLGSLISNTPIAESSENSLISNATIAESSEDSLNKKRMVDQVTETIPSYMNKISASPEKLFENVDQQLVACLQTINLTEKRNDFMNILKEVGKQEKLKVTCVEEKIGNLAQCLIQLNTIPVAVSGGIGNNFEEVQEVAARDMLNYLKMLTSSTNR